jgi:hypothetical protein
MMRRLTLNATVRVVMLAVFLLGSLPLATVRGQETLDSAAPEALPAVTTTENEAESDFPDGITFSLDAETSDPVVNVELHFWAPGMKTISVELPPFAEGATELDIDQPVDMRTGQLPPGVDVNYRWRITEDDGDVIETEERTRFWIDDRFNWTPLVGPNVTVYAYDGDPAFQQSVLDTAEQTITTLAERYDATLDQRVRIWVYANLEDYNAVQGPNFQPHTAGVNRPTVYLVHSVLPSGNLDEVGRVIPHEFSHQILYQATSNPFGQPPQWLDEGLAVYSQERGRDRLYTYALQLAANGDVMPLRTLNGDFPYDRGGFTAGYAFSLTVVAYIIDTWGNEGISRLIDTFAEGVRPEDGVQQALGISFDELDRQWSEDLIAKSEQLTAAGSTRFGDGEPAAPAGAPSFGQDVAIASGTLILGLAVLIAVVAGVVSWLRLRRRPEPDDELPHDGPRWVEFPEGLETPGWQARSPGQP